MKRRNFISACCLYSGSMMVLNAGPPAVNSARAAGNNQSKTEARWYEKLPHKKIKCKLCPRECVIDDRERGYCGVRENWDGIYYTLVHSKPCTYHIDPIEKKPLYHFLPGTPAFSLATVGCNVDCKFCQNWQISQVRPEQVNNLDMPPDRVVEMTRSSQSQSIAFTYSEPVVFAEYIYDTAYQAKKQNLRTVMISNGYIQTEPMRQLTEVLSAVKIDLKAFSEKYYREVVAGELQPVLDTLVQLKKSGIWFEIVYLVVPTLNDSDYEFKQLSNWIIEHLGDDVPVHFTRFHPQYKLQNLPPTPRKTLERAWGTASSAGMKYVYIGNIPGHEAENTICPECSGILIQRFGFRIVSNNLEEGKCPNCGAEIPGVWA